MEKIVMSEEEILSVCKKIGAQLTEELKNEEKLPLFVGVMKGAMNFFMDLLKRVDRYVYTDYIQVKSYEGTSSTGNVKFLKELSMDPKGRTIIIVEDVIETGTTMKALINYLKDKEAKRVILVALFDKKFCHDESLKVDYCGKELTESSFLMGYGLDYNEIDRNVPYVYNPDQKQINEWDEIIKNNR